MKRVGLLVFAATVLLVGGWRLAAQGNQANQTPPPVTEGTLVDGRCYMMNAGNIGDDHGNTKQCGMACMKSGAPAALLTADKRLLPIMTYSTAFADIVGQPVRVTGEVHDGAIRARKVEVNKGGQWQDVKFATMQK